MAKELKKKAGVASMNPDNMASAGLPDDFDGLITEVRLAPWDYDGKIDHHVLAARITVQPDADSGIDGPITQHYSAGDLEHFVPSMDGEEGIDLEADDASEMEGVFALRVGKREQLNSNSNWAHFIGAAIDAGFPTDKLEADVRCFEGVYGHFNRIPQKKRSGIVVQEEGQRQKTILVLTEIKEAPKAAKSAPAKGKPAPAGKAAKAEPEADDLDTRLTEVLVEALGEADDNTIAKAKLAGIVIKAFTGAEKAKAVKRVTSTEYLESADAFVFDADEGTITLA